METQEFADVFASLYPDLVAFASEQVSSELAEDCAASALTLLWEQRVAAPRDARGRARLRQAADRLVQGQIDRVLLEERELADALEALSIHSVALTPVHEPDPPAWRRVLTAYELEILELVGDGFTMNEIAQLIGIGAHVGSNVVPMKVFRARRRARAAALAAPMAAPIAAPRDGAVTARPSDDHGDAPTAAGSEGSRTPSRREIYLPRPETTRRRHEAQRRRK